MRANACGCVPIELYLQMQAVGQMWRGGSQTQSAGEEDVMEESFHEDIKKKN